MDNIWIYIFQKLSYMETKPELKVVYDLINFKKLSRETK